MSRIQLALNVDDLEQAVTFYSRLFGAEPAKRKPGYANFAVAEPPLKLVLIENPGKGGSINHLGVEVESSEQVHAEIARLSGAGLFTDEEMGTTCCFATQDKVWVTGPGGERWEVYTVLSDSDTYGAGPRDAAAGQAPEESVCCGATQTAEQDRRDEPAPCCAGACAAATRANPESSAEAVTRTLRVRIGGRLRGEGRKPGGAALRRLLGGRSGREGVNRVVRGNGSR